MKFASGVPLSYRFEVYNAGGNRVYQSGLVPSGSGTTSHDVEGALEPDQTYSWQARPEYLGTAGPWSPRTIATFIAPNTVGYIRGNEIYDPLVNGKTVGKISGPVTWVPGVGVKIESLLSHIAYDLQQTLVEGEFSLLVTDMPANTEGGKTKVFSMSEGYDDIITNDRRFTVEKRGDPPGIIAWRFITGDDQIDTEGHERVPYNFQSHLTYFWQATWRSNFFNVLIKEGGVDGRVVYDYGKHWQGRPYDPDPHTAFVGAPVGRSGPDGASVEGMVVRQLWISHRPRPAFANK